MNKIIIDADRIPIGRVASQAARILNGKDDINYSKNKITTKIVCVTNIEKAVFTGRKLDQNKYYRHSGYPGAIKSRTLRESFEKDPVKCFGAIVRGMIKSNRLTEGKLKRLIVEK